MDLTHVAHDQDSDAFNHNVPILGSVPRTSSLATLLPIALWGTVTCFSPLILPPQCPFRRRHSCDSSLALGSRSPHVGTARGRNRSQQVHTVTIDTRFLVTCLKILRTPMETQTTLDTSQSSALTRKRHYNQLTSATNECITGANSPPHNKYLWLINLDSHVLHMIPSGRAQHHPGFWVNWQDLMQCLF